MIFEYRLNQWSLDSISSRRLFPVFDEDFYSFYKIYTQSFPPEERRSKEQLLEEIANPRADVSFILVDGIYENSFDNRVGIFIHWDLDDFVYIGHFAVAEHLRGRKIGETFLKKFLASLNKPAVLEVEEPGDTNTISAQRIEFYERLGFSLFLCDYIQPAYSADKLCVPLYLMETVKGFLSKHYKYVRDKIYKEVYNFTGTP